VQDIMQAVCVLPSRISCTGRQAVFYLPRGLNTFYATNLASLGVRVDGSAIRIFLLEIHKTCLEETRFLSCLEHF